jgi:RimJ/RimL family protein N-acetyltransferase
VLRGDRVVLRATERADLPDLWELLEDPEVAALAENGPITPTSLASYEARFDRLLAQPRPDLVEFTIQADGAVIGQCQLYAIDHFHRRCELGISIGRRHWGHGYGQDAVRVLVSYAFDHLDMRRVGLRVLAEDDRAVGAYRKAGFVEEGRLRRYTFKDGRVQDDLLMAVIRDEHEPAR